MTREPASDYVRFPDEYGDPTAAPLRDWSEIEKLLEAAPNYWLASIGPDGGPHLRPVDGVWVEGTLCFGGSPETRWVRNLRANPAASINLGSESDAIILEGTAEEIADPSHPLARLSTEASFRKYPQYHPAGQMPDEPAVPFWCFRPSRAFAWRLADFPRAATRWTFEG